jgi:LmbE family N-acetylglucosaminyl deacetylase
MWAMAQDEGWVRSLEEFGRLTPGMFEALKARRAIRHRYACLYAGIAASTIANFAGKTLAENARVSAMDFVPGVQEDSRLDALRHNIQNFVGLIMAFSPQTSVTVVREKLTTNLVQGGYSKSEVDSIFAEMFPKWVQ